ncbi:MAG: Na/Pi cotransporter family protein [Flavobacteriales bacterium]|nr:Na/Pi cotransporter family protein [Flavobacteriales bacterium]
MWEHLDIWLLLAGLGIFLFGIRLIEDSIAKLGGRSFKRLVREGTSTRGRAIATGTVATALLQSSSAVTLMVLAFVGAGIVTLESGIGVVLGSNIGTTATSWIVATIGFKLDIEQLALPFIGVGGLVLIFLGKSPRYSQVSHLLVGFGFLFLGLDQMKDSVSAFAEDFDPSLLVNARPWVFLLMGLVLTAAMQSSSATVAILLTALYAGVFDFREGALAIIGSNVGTTITVFLGALGGTVVKKRLAWSHLSFNTFAAVIALAGLSIYLRAVSFVLGEGFDPVMGLALFHTLFNLVGVLVFLPFVTWFSGWIKRAIPEKEEQRTRFIGRTVPDVPEAAITGVRNEVRQLLLETIGFHLDLVGIEKKLVLPDGAQLMEQEDHATYQEHYTALKLLQADIITFVTQVEKHELTEAESHELNRMVHAARLALYAAKNLKDVKGNIDGFEDTSAFLDRFHAMLRKRMMVSHMRIAKVLEDGEPHDDVTELAAIMRVLEQADANGMREVNIAAREGHLRSIDLSTAQLVNRAISRSTHDLALAAAELVLPPAEYHTLERMQEVEEAIGGADARLDA